MRKILVLSGGGSFGCYEAGILCNIIASGNGSWDFITGVSAGSINASYLSTIDKDSEKDYIDIIKNLWIGIKNSDVFEDEFFLNGLSVYNSDKFKSKIESVYKDKGLVPKRPLLIGSTSLSKNCSQVFSNDDIEKYGFTDLILCSTSIPIVFQPYSFLDDMFIDGGLTGNILFDEAVNYAIENFPGEDVQIDVIICGKKINKEVINKDNITFLKLLEKVWTIMLQQTEYSEILKTIDIPGNIKVMIYEQKTENGTSFLNFDNAEELWNEGYSMSNVETYELK